MRGLSRGRWSTAPKSHQSTNIDRTISSHQTNTIDTKTNTQKTSSASQETTTDQETDQTYPKNQAFNPTQASAAREIARPNHEN